MWRNSTEGMTISPESESELDEMNERLGFFWRRERASEVCSG